MSAATRSHRPDRQPPPRPQLPLRRLLLLTVVTAAIAFAFQALLAATSAPSASATTLFVIPLAAGVVVFAGLRPYPLAGRLRLAAMVAIGLFLVGLGL